MSLLPVDGHGVVAVRHVVHDRFFRIERGAELIEIADFEPRPVPDGAFRGFEFAEKEAEQGGLAHAVVADEPDAVPALDDGRKRVEYAVAVWVGESRLFRLDNQLAGAFRLLREHGNDALTRHAGHPFGTHGLQRADAAHVAGAAGLDALPYPRFFLREFLVEGRGLFFLGVEAFLPAFEELVERAGITVELGAVHLHDPRGEAADKSTVMADEDEGFDPPDEEIFQPRDGLDVQMVGGLVEQQVFGGDEGAGQRHAALVPSGKCGEVRLGIEPELVDRLKDVAVAFPAFPALEEVAGQRQFGGGELILAARGNEMGGGQRFAFLAEP